MTDEDIYNSPEEEILLEEETKVKEPPKFKVLLHNDDYTPMDFVVHILQKFFSIDSAKATRIMLMVHNSGIGLCGVFPREIAETKVHIVNDYSRKHQYPLKCTMEKE